MKKLLTATLFATLIGSTLAVADEQKPTPNAGKSAASAPVSKKAAQPTEAQMIAAAAKGQVAQLDADKDGKLSKTEFMAPGEAMFAKVDADKNGNVTQAEIEAVFRERQAAQKKAMAAQAEMREKMLKMLKDAEAQAAKKKPAAAAKP